jgi:hypothetical protein
MPQAEAVEPVSQGPLAVAVLGLERDTMEVPVAALQVFTVALSLTVAPALRGWETKVVPVLVLAVLPVVVAVPVAPVLTQTRLLISALTVAAVFLIALPAPP